MDYVYTRIIILLQHLVIVDICDCLSKCIVMPPHYAVTYIYRRFCINGAHAACNDSGGAVEVHETGD